MFLIFLQLDERRATLGPDSKKATIKNVIYISSYLYKTRKEFHVVFAVLIIAETVECRRYVP